MGNVMLKWIFLVALVFHSIGLPSVQAETRGVYIVPKAGHESELEGEIKVYNRSYAVVIGVDKYSYLPKLKGAVRDARAVAKILKKQGFTVTTLENKKATRSRIAALLGDKLAREVRRDDRVLVFFAGHGVSTGSGNTAMGYLMPIEGKRSSPRGTGISMTELQNWFADYQAKHVMFVADSCYSGLALSTRAVGLDPESRDYLKQITSKPVRIALVAGGAGEEANEWRGHGLFTKFFLEALGGSADADKDGLITSDEIAAFVKPNVTQTARQYFRAVQQPQMGRRGEGEFVFLNPRGAKNRLGSIRVISDPKGGQIFINGKDSGLVTPGVIEKLAQGKYEVEIRKDNRRSQPLKVDVIAGIETPVALALPIIKLDGGINVNSNIEGAEIFIDGRDTGEVTPAMLGNINSGKHLIRLEKQGYKPIDANVEVVHGEVAQLSIQLSRRMGNLIISTINEPTQESVEADVYINDKRFGTTKYSTQLPPGKYIVRVETKEHQTVEQEVIVLEDKKTDVKVAMIPSMGTLIVSAANNATGQDLSAWVLIDGKTYGTTTTSIRLMPGDYDLEVRYQEAKPYFKRVSIQKELTSEVNAMFSWADDDPGVVQQSPEKDGLTKMAVAGWSTLGTGAAMVLLGGVMTKLEIDENAKEQNTGNANQTAYQAYQGTAIAGYAVGGALLITGVVLLVVDAKNDNQFVAQAIPAIGTDGQGVYANWQVKW